MYFDNYTKFPTAVVNPSLLWEYDLEKFDFENMRDVVVQRVVERGWLTDWYAILNLYSKQGVIDAIKNIPQLNSKDMNFVHIVFNIPLKDLKCSTKKRSHQKHWAY